MRNIGVFAVGMSLGLVGCAGQIDDPVSSEPLQVSTHTDVRVIGTYDAGGVVVGFKAVMPEGMVGVVDVTVGEQTLSYYADAELGEIDIAVDGVTLSEADRAALEGLRDAIDAYMGRIEDTAAMHESVLYSATQYFAEAPVGTPLQGGFHQVEGLGAKISYAVGEGVPGDHGKFCIRQGEWRTAAYNGSQGTHIEGWVVGSHGGYQWNGDFSCMGRCGVGCGSFDWTLDCLEHDACARRYYASTSGADHNCGDEWTQSGDDYSFWWRRCRS